MAQIDFHAGHGASARAATASKIATSAGLTTAREMTLVFFRRWPDRRDLRGPAADGLGSTPVLGCRRAALEPSQ
jgi:hypothetical protein